MYNKWKWNINKNFIIQKQNEYVNKFIFFECQIKLYNKSQVLKVNELNIKCFPSFNLRRKASALFQYQALDIGHRYKVN